MELSELRKQIDKIDDQLVSLFLTRMDIAAQVAATKKAQNLPIFVPEREQEKLNMVASQAPEPMADYVRSLYRSIFELSRHYQRSHSPKFGLLGCHLSHSYSPAIHSQLGGYPYTLIEKEPEDIANFLAHGDFMGLNVTIPYKKSVMKFCQELTPTAKALGAVNTVVRRPDGHLVGHNTDYFGFQTLLYSTGLSVEGKKVLVLGSGGASNTACAVLKEHRAQAVVISRSGENHYGNLHLHSDAALIVNTTPVGMYPDNGVSPVDLSLFPHLEGVIDVIYNPARTQLLLDAEGRGLVAANGLLMLVAQAWESAQWFMGKELPKTLISEIHNTLSHGMQNIVLIGMPGCGKTTVGQLLAKKTGRTFLDADTCIADKAGKSVPEIFSQDGEARFRALETEVITELGKQSGLIIATGGGCVTREENYPLLHQNGHIFWLKRPIEDLPTVGRPLSQTTDLSVMYRVRQPLYAQFADTAIHNTDPETAANTILTQTGGSL